MASQSKMKHTNRSIFAFVATEACNRQSVVVKLISKPFNRLESDLKRILCC